MFRDKEILSRINELERQIASLEGKVDGLLSAIALTIGKAGGNEMAETPAIEAPKREAPESEEKKQAKNELREEWRQVIFRGSLTEYEVSSHGRVRNSKGKLMHITRNAQGKPRIWIYYFDKDEGYVKGTSSLIKNLVARAFINPKLGSHTRAVRCIDGDENNCRVDNLYVISEERRYIKA